jgi:hypothetical protein
LSAPAITVGKLPTWDGVERVYGGERGIRTPGSLSTTPDFESGAFNRTLPSLRIVLTIYRSSRFIHRKLIMQQREVRIATSSVRSCG